MQKRLLPLIASMLFLSLFVTSCQDDDPPVVVKTKTQLLSQTSWKFSDATVGGAPAAVALQACQKDNVLTFAAAGTGTADEGATKCNAADPQTSNFTWNFQSSETILFISTILFTGGSSTFTVVSLTETQLVVSQVVTLGGLPQTVVVTFVH